MILYLVRHDRSVLKAKPLQGFHVGPVAPDNARPDLPTSPHAMLRAIRSPGLKYGEDTLLDYNKAPPAVAPPPNLWELDEDTRNEVQYLKASGRQFRHPCSQIYYLV